MTGRLLFFRRYCPKYKSRSADNEVEKVLWGENPWGYEVR